MSDVVELVTIAEVAERLRLSRRTVERLLESRQLRSVAIGRRRLVTSRDLADYVAGRRPR